MNTNRFSLLSISLLVILATLLAACAPAATPTSAPVEPEPAVTDPPAEVPTEAPTQAALATLQYWHTHSVPQTAKLEEVIAAFEASNPGITVETTRFAYSDFKTALLTAISSGEVPDVARLDIAWGVNKFAMIRARSVPLDGNMPEFDEIIKDTFPGWLSTNLWEGHYYGLPLDTNTQVLLWNKGLFEEAGITAPPATMEEFATVACQMSDVNNKYGYAQGLDIGHRPQSSMQWEGKVTDENITTATGYVQTVEARRRSPCSRIYMTRAVCPRTCWVAALPRTLVMRKAPMR